MATLRKTIDQFQIDVPESAYAPIKHYCQSLWELNKTLNLTRHTSYEKFVTRDLLDSVELAKLIPEHKKVLDVGSGGGVPGILLAILRPDLKMTLAESVGKKALALGEMAEALELKAVIYQCRAEDLLADVGFDYTTARAVGPLKKIGRWFEHVWPSVGKLLAIKGPKWPAEKAEADEANLLKRVDLRVVSEYDVPGVDWKSVILQLTGR
jgi:16S rRNA (guanine527-N7)-methyltransferase